MKKRIVEKIIRNHEWLNNAHAFGWKIPKIAYHSSEQVEHLKYAYPFYFGRNKNENTDKRAVN